MTSQDELSFLPDADRKLMARGQEIAASIVANVRDGLSYWGTWEALNVRLVSGSTLRNALEWHTPRGLGTLRSALGEATILALMRMSDSAQDDASLSACGLAGLLANEKVVSVLTSEAWIRKGRSDLIDGIVASEMKAQPKRISWFRERVPLGWGRGDSQPDVADLTIARTALREIRNRRIAHSLSGEVNGPSIDQIRGALRLSTDLAVNASSIFLGGSSGLRGDIAKHVQEHDAVWVFFESGLVGAHRDWSATVEDSQ